MVLGQEAWGHAVTELLDALRPAAAEIDEALLDRARALDKLFIPTRDPNYLSRGAPADFYTRSEAERAIADAEAVHESCRRVAIAAGRSMNRLILAAHEDDGRPNTGAS